MTLVKREEEKTASPTRDRRVSARLRRGRGCGTTEPGRPETRKQPETDEPTTGRARVLWSTPRLSDVGLCRSTTRTR